MEARIQCVCGEFAAFSGFLPAQLQDQPASSLAAARDALRSLIASAASGRARRAALPVLASAAAARLCFVLCAPIVSHAGGQVTHVLMLFKPLDGEAARRDARHAGPGCLPGGLRLGLARRLHGAAAAARRPAAAKSSVG